MQPKPISLRAALKKPAAITLWGLAALLCAKSFVINPELYAGKSAVPAATTDYLWSFVGLCLTWLFYRTFEVARCRPRAGEMVFGLLFGVVNFFGTSLFAYDSWAFIGVFTSWPMAIVKCLGQGFTMTAALTRLVCYLTSGALTKPDAPLALSPRFARAARFFRACEPLCLAAVVLLGWSPYLIAYFPGTPNYDIAFMMQEFFGITPMTTWHGVFLTWVLGAFVGLGRLLGSDNLGAGLFMLAQAACMAFSCGLCVSGMRRLHTRRLWRVLALAFYTVVPFYGFYAEMLCKDTLYASAMLLFTLQTIVFTRAGGKEPPRARDAAAYGFTALLCCLWRNNGLYVVLPTAALAVLFCAKGSARARVGAALGAAVALTLLYANVLIPALGITDNTTSGVYSVCFQQTARVVRDHYDELTEEEKTEIDRVLDLEKIRYLYEPWISDPVKDTFRQFGQGKEAEKAALERYRAVWGKMLFKYPLEYAQAFMGGNCAYYAFTPMFTGITHNQQAGMRVVLYTYTLEGEGQMVTRQSEALQPARNLLSAWALRWRTFPMLAMLYVCPFYTWILIGGGIALARRRRYRELVAYVPALFSFAVCLLAPANDYFRYFLPIVTVSLPLIALAGDVREEESR